jgi:transcriptional regulator
MTQRRTVKPEVLDKEIEVVKLRRGGLTWDLIAERVGYGSASAAHAAYQRAARRAVQDDIEAIRTIENERLDLMQSAIWGKVLAGDTTAIQTVIRLMERRAKLLGLDQPFKQQIEVTTYDGDTIDSEVRKLVELLDSGKTGQVVIPTSEIRAVTD